MHLITVLRKPDPAKDMWPTWCGKSVTRTEATYVTMSATCQACQMAALAYDNEHAQ